MIKIFGTIVFMVSILLMGSCSKGDLNKDSASDTQVLDKGSFNFVKNALIYNEADQKRSEAYSASFDIVKVERIGEILNITVSFLKGCEVSKFDVVWNGTVLMS